MIELVAHVLEPACRGERALGAGRRREQAGIEVFEPARAAAKRVQEDVVPERPIVERAAVRLDDPLQ
jgi:hypothetical protein